MCKLSFWKRLKFLFTGRYSKKKRKVPDILTFVEELSLDGSSLKLRDYQAESLQPSLLRRVRRWDQGSGKTLVAAVEAAYYLKYPEFLVSDSNSSYCSILFFAPKKSSVESFSNLLLKLVSSNKELVSRVAVDKRGIIFSTQKDNVTCSVCCGYSEIVLCSSHADLIILDQVDSFSSKLLNCIIPIICADPNVKLIACGTSSDSEDNFSIF